MDYKMVKFDLLWSWTITSIIFLMIIITSFVGDIFEFWIFVALFLVLIFLHIFYY